jgi:hypothetical protein
LNLKLINKAVDNNFPERSRRKVLFLNLILKCRYNNGQYANLNPII